MVALRFNTKSPEPDIMALVPYTNVDSTLDAIKPADGEKKAFRLMDLLPELRLMIWDEWHAEMDPAILRLIPTRPYKDKYSKSLDLLLTSRQVHQEAGAIFWSSVRVDLSGANHNKYPEEQELRYSHTSASYNASGVAETYLRAAPRLKRTEQQLYQDLHAKLPLLSNVKLDITALKECMGFEAKTNGPVHSVLTNIFGKLTGLRTLHIKDKYFFSEYCAMIGADKPNGVDEEVRAYGKRSCSFVGSKQDFDDLVASFEKLDTIEIFSDDKNLHPQGTFVWKRGRQVFFNKTRQEELSPWTEDSTESPQA